MAQELSFNVSGTTSESTEYIAHPPGVYQFRVIDGRLIVKSGTGGGSGDKVNIIRRRSSSDVTLGYFNIASKAPGSASISYTPNTSSSANESIVLPSDLLKVTCSALAGATVFDCRLLIDECGSVGSLSNISMD